MVKKARPGNPDRDSSQARKWSPSERLWYDIGVIGATSDSDRFKEILVDVYRRLPRGARNRALQRIASWILADAAFPWTFPPSEADSTVVIVPGGYLRRSNRWLCRTVAHEIAHVLLERSPCERGGRRAERVADNLCEKWGFGRAYSKKALAKFAY